MKILKINQKFIKTFTNNLIFFIIFLFALSCEKNNISNFTISEDLLKFLNNNNFESKFIAHAAGGVNFDTYTNSVEALEKSINNGYRLIEIDLMKTSDDFFIGGHSDWPSFKKKLSNSKYQTNDKAMTLDEVKNSKVYDKYRPLNIDYINEILSKRLDYIMSFFNEYGFKSDEIKEAQKVIINSLNSLLNSEDGKWIYQPYQDDTMEAVYLFDEENIYKKRIPDRTFIYDNKRWIVDYKVVFNDKNLNLEAKKHTAQLKNYEALFDDKYQIQKAIYFTAQGCLVLL